jgi:hypothetical protein
MVLASRVISAIRYEVVIGAPIKARSQGEGGEDMAGGGELRVGVVGPTGEGAFDANCTVKEPAGGPI